MSFLRRLISGYKQLDVGQPGVFLDDLTIKRRLVQGGPFEDLTSGGTQVVSQEVTTDPDTFVSEWVTIDLGRPGLVRVELMDTSFDADGETADTSYADGHIAYYFQLEQSDDASTWINVPPTYTHTIGVLEEGTGGYVFIVLVPRYARARMVVSGDPAVCDLDDIYNGSNHPTVTADVTLTG